jgi:hypothetical protein
MSKERKTRNFDFLKQIPPELPSREEVIQKTAELTGTTFQSPEVTPSPIVSGFATVSTPVEVLVVPKKVKLPVEKKKKEPKLTPMTQKTVTSILPVEPIIVEKAKVGRKALADSRKPFTTTITVDNKRRLRELCAQYDIAMSDVINEILAAQFEQRPSQFV